jgi:hypothetical protein
MTDPAKRFCFKEWGRATQKIVDEIVLGVDARWAKGAVDAMLDKLDERFANPNPSKRP